MTPDQLLDALLARVIAGDPEAAAFFPVFRDWWLELAGDNPAPSP